MTLPPPFSRYLVAHGAASFALGIHIVFLAWLSVGYLGLPASLVGWVNALALVPGFFLIPIAGVCADRFNPSVILRYTQLTLSACYFFLGTLIATDNLNFYTLSLYGMLAGGANAFVQPVREKLMVEVSARRIQRKISASSIVQFSLQSLGILIASVSEHAGFAIVVWAQGLVSLISPLLYSSLRQTVAGNRHDDKRLSLRRFYGDAATAISEFKANVALRHLILLVGFNGYMHMGVFIVTLPLVARDIYGMSTTEYALLQLVFVIGMISAHWRLLVQESVKHPGHGALFSLLYTAIIGVALAKQPTVTGLYMVVLAWGWVAGNSAAHCRLVLQYVTQRQLKGRLMSLYQFALFGLAPLGALVTGYFIHYFSFAQIFTVMSASSVAIFILFIFSRTLWKVEHG